MSSPTADLGRQIGPLRRTLLRRTRTAAGLPDLPDAQIEALRALGTSGPTTPSELADDLQLARSTVSNLVRSLVDAGLVERRSGADHRSVTVGLTGLAGELLHRYDEAATEVLDGALGELSLADRDALVAAVPALSRLNDVLRDRA